MTITTMHGEKRDEDLIDDDKYKIIKVKNDFIDLMNNVMRISDSSEVIDSLICAEEHLNEALSAEWDSLCGESGGYDDIPQSVPMRAWMMMQRQKTFRPQSTRGGVPTNPATLLAKGEVL